MVRRYFFVFEYRCRERHLNDFLKKHVDKISRQRISKVDSEIVHLESRRQKWENPNGHNFEIDLQDLNFGVQLFGMISDQLGTLDAIDVYLLVVVAAACC